MTLMLSFVRRYVMPFWLWFVAGSFFLFITNYLAVQIPIQLAKAIDAIRVGNQPQTLYYAIVTIAVMGALVIIVRTLSRVLFFTPGRLVEYQLKNDMFDKLLRLQPSFYSEWQTGDIVSRTANDMTFVRVMVGFGTLQVINITTALLLAGTQMLLLSPWLTLLILIPLGVGMLVVNVGIRRLFDLSRQSQEEMSSLSEHILASLQGVQTIQGFNAQEAFHTRFLKRNKDYMTTNLKLVNVRVITLPVLALSGAMCIWVLLAFGGPMAIRKEISVGQLVAFTSYIALLLMPLRSLGWLMSVFQRGRTSLERVMELLDVEPERPDLPDPIHTQPGKGPGFRFKQLSFAYPDDPDNPVLHDIDVELPAGKMIGVFGRTGSGKTTLLRLLSRAYNAQPEQLFVDDIDITKLHLDEWRKRMSVVTQSPFLFSDDIATNIAMGERPREEIEQVIDSAALRRDLESLPDGLDTIVGERGIMLSGGQRQRVALARALCRPFDFLILDDVLSAVDHQTEHTLIETIKQIGHSRPEAPPTTILVSHRLSALCSTDLILVLEQGKLVDKGTHQELIRREGPYKEAWELQSNKVDDEGNPIEIPCDSPSEGTDDSKEEDV